MTLTKQLKDASLTAVALKDDELATEQATNKSLINVFVYGTLKKGESANYKMGPNYLGSAVINGYDLNTMGSFPCITPSNKEETLVYGDVYQVDDATLATLDSYEGIEHGLFRKIKVTASIYSEQREEKSSLQDNLEGNELTCYAYLWGKDHPPHSSARVPSGVWTGRV